VPEPVKRAKGVLFELSASPATLLDPMPATPLRSSLRHPPFIHEFRFLAFLGQTAQHPVTASYYVHLFGQPL
jgi:hypothetical protein